jgi:stage V sporulation protein AC
LNNKKYQELVKSYSIENNVFNHAIISFLSGGILGMLAHLLTSFYIRYFNMLKEDALTLMSITFIIVAIILTGLNVFDRLVKVFRFGLIIPITGFAHSVASCMLDYNKDGFINGVGSNMFKLAGSVILYGVSFAFIFGIIKVIIYG